MDLKRLSTMAYVGIILLFATVVIGAFTRAYDAGMGCGPDWPTCNGQILPTLEFVVLLEYFHRVAAGLGFIIVTYVVYMSLKLGIKELKGWSVATLLALVTQVLLGAVVVWYHLSPPLSALHTTLAIVTIALATGLAVKIQSLGNSGSTRLH